MEFIERDAGLSGKVILFSALQVVWSDKIGPANIRRDNTVHVLDSVSAYLFRAALPFCSALYIVNRWDQLEQLLQTVRRVKRVTAVVRR